MKVKIGNRIYDSEHEIIMIILSDADKKNIAEMHPDCEKYCSYPSDIYQPKFVEQWMKEDGTQTRK